MALRELFLAQGIHNASLITFCNSTPTRNNQNPKTKMKINPNLKKEASNRGFTLIELIASIAILTVITAFAANRYGVVINDSRTAKTATVINAIEKAKELFIAEDNRTSQQITAFNALPADQRINDLLPYIRVNGVELTSGSLLLDGTGKTTIDTGIILTGTVTTGGTITLN
jgi:prepilin-type N-terminal cleavage/methylation domain-containing protein